MVSGLSVLSVFRLLREFYVVSLADFEHILSFLHSHLF